MSELRFETPENITISYQPAGLGTRFIAWFVDQILVTVLTIVLLILLIVVGVSIPAVASLVDDLDEDSLEAMYFIVGLMMLAWGLGSFLYFGLFELLMRGQTPGKRTTKIRVVKGDGFSLDSTAILVRNVFRVIDQLPLLWIVPLLSEKSQRPGDMVGGTLVVHDEAETISEVRTELAERSALESRFRFQPSELKQLTAVDIKAIETLLERWPRLPQVQRSTLLDNIVQKLVIRLNTEAPNADERLQFLEDLLAADIRRQHRSLG